MRYFLVLFVLLFQGQFSIKAFSLSDVDYTTADSVQVVQWLDEAREQYVKTDRMLFFAKKLHLRNGSKRCFGHSTRR